MPPNVPKQQCEILVRLLNRIKWPLIFFFCFAAGFVNVRFVFIPHRQADKRVAAQDAARASLRPTVDVQAKLAFVETGSASLCFCRTWCLHMDTELGKPRCGFAVRARVLFEITKNERKDIASLAI